MSRLQSKNHGDGAAIRTCLAFLFCVLASVQASGDLRTVLRDVQAPFVANQGELDAEIAFYARTYAGTVAVTLAGEIRYASSSDFSAGDAPVAILIERVTSCAALDVCGLEPGPTRVNRFIGRDPSRWQRDVPSFESIALPAIADGVDLTLRAYGNNVEKLFVVRPGADPAAIDVRIEGAAGLTVNDAGELVVRAAAGNAKFTRPVAYQDIDGERRGVCAEYRLRDNSYGFEVGEYDPSHPLVIDPLLAATYIGGARGDGLGEIPIARDAQGNIYIADRTNSDDIPGTDAGYQPNRAGGRDVFIAKLSPDLSTLLAATYLGGTTHDGEWPGVGLTLDDEGFVYVVAETLSNDFPAFPGISYDSTYAGNADVFIAKLTPDLDELIASTYLGGTLKDDAHCIAVSDCVYVVGCTASPAASFPVTPGAFQTVNYAGGARGLDAFAAKFDKNLSTLIAATFLGGHGDDIPEMLVLDQAGNLGLPGWTTSQDFPTSPDAFDRIYNGGSYDAFVTMLSPDLTAIVASTYLGGDDWDFGYALTIDAQQNVYVTGHTASASPAAPFPTTPGSLDRTYNGAGGADVGDDAYVAKFDSNLHSLLASTYLGGSGWEIGSALGVDELGFVFIAGSTNSADFPVPDAAFDRVYSGGDNHYAAESFVARLDPQLATLYAATYFGGSANDHLGSLLLAPGGEVTLGIGTASPGLPTSPDAYDHDFNGGISSAEGYNWGGDCFIARLDSTLSACFGDLEGDGTIGLSDLAQLLGHYGQTAGAKYADGDLSGDGCVDLQDLAALLGCYGLPCE